MSRRFKVIHTTVFTITIVYLYGCVIKTPFGKQFEGIGRQQKFRNQNLNLYHYYNTRVRLSSANNKYHVSTHHIKVKIFD